LCHTSDWADRRRLSTALATEDNISRSGSNNWTELRSERTESWSVLPRSCCPLWVKDRLRDDVGIATAVPRIADDLLHRPSRQRWATTSREQVQQKRGPAPSACSRS
jgi:hypothetical protein